MSEMLRLEDDQRLLRRKVLTHYILHALRDTIRLQGMTPTTPVDEVRAEFTDASARLIAQFVEAIDILESIIWASDGCVGHRNCRHSMEPWQCARALLQDKWSVHADGRQWPEFER